MIEYFVLLLMIAVFIVLIRLARGPTPADRVLATDTINSVIIGVVVLLGVYYQNHMLVDIAIVYAMVSFLATLSISKYLMKKEMHEE